MTRHPSPAALRALPAALALALPVLMPGCSSQLSLPEGAQVRCDGSAPCPSGHVCRTELGRCVRAGGADSAAPGLEAGSVAIEPALARRDAAVLVRFRASEPLGAPPGLQLRLPDPVAVPLAPGPTPDDPDLPTFLFRYETTGREPQGVPFDLVAQLVDRAGNVAREVPVGQLAFDFAPPRLQEAAALGPATLRPGATARLLLRSSEELVRAPQIRRAPGGVPHPCEPTWQEHGYACSEELPPTCEEGPLSLDVALEDLAGNVGQHTLAELFRVDATAPAGLDVRAQQWLELLYSPTGWSGSAGEPHGELRVCPPPVSRPSEERPPSGEEGPRSEGERPESGRRERADPWSWCPAGLRPAEALEPGALLIVTAAAWIGGELRCGEQELGRARLDPDPGQGLVLPLAPPTSEACVALEDEAGNRSPASPVERIELALTASSQPRPGALRVEERPLFGGQLEPEGRSPLVAGDRLALPDDGLVAVTHGAGRWQQPSLARPAERWGHVLARDTARGRSLLFGGQNPRRLDDTWEWDGRSWLPVRLPEDGEAPQARAFAALAWDAARGKAVLFGGEGAEGLLDDTWEWNGKSWSRCRILPGVDGPTPRRRHALVYDGASRMVLLFGGEDRDGQRLADAWRWDGERWQPIPRSTGEPATGWPEPRAEHALAYDRAQRLVVLYGGRRHEGPDGDLADTWGWDGRIWRELTSDAAGQPGPGPRRGHAMEYDPAGRRVLLLGGATSPAEAADLWSWDGGRWLALQPRGVEQPPARRWHALAFDPVRGRALLFGGAAQAALGDTWEWDGEQWERTAPDAGSVQPVQPGARSFHAMATDLLGQKLVLFGGHAWSGLADLWLDDTWEWDGWTWSRVEPPGYRPTARSGHAMAGVGQEGMVALFGGYGRRAGSGTRLADLWLFDGSAWSEQQGEDPQGDGGPAGRNWHALSYDTQRGRLVLFGGRAGQLLGDTWEWDGRSWRDCSPGPEEPAPAPRDAHAMAFDPRRGRVVLHGGRDLASAPLGDLWEWDGARWQLVPAGANRSIPPPRLSHGLAWDESSGAVLLYGGSDGTGTVHGDLWAWDGATWRELSSPRHLADGPRPRLGHAVAADPHGQKLVAFGGHAQQIDQRFADTWEWSAAAGERPAQVARVALGPLVGSRPVEWLELGLWLRAGGLAPGASGMGEGANLYLWEQGCWEEAARGLPDPELPPTTPGDPGLGTLQWSSVDPERIAGLLFGPEQDLACALTPAGPNGPGGGRIASDYLELRVRMRRVP